MSDETRPFPPYGDDDGTNVQPPSGPGHPDEGPRSGDAWVFDRTRQQPPVSDDDATVVSPRPPRRDATSIMPPTVADPPPGPGAPWAGRAEVHAPRAGDYAETDWATELPPGEPRGKWWMPILVGIVGLILIGLLGWGIWLIIQNTDKSGTNTPTPAPTVSTAPATTPPTTEPTTAAPTTQATTSPAPTSVTVPALRGRSQAEAIQALSRSGLSARLRYVSTGDAPAGTVVDSDPSEGQEVPPDTTVTLIIAAPPTTAPAATPGDGGGADD